MYRCEALEFLQWLKSGPFSFSGGTYGGDYYCRYCSIGIGARDHEEGCLGQKMHDAQNLIEELGVTFKKENPSGD